jgi:hypothetical protein
MSNEAPWRVVRPSVVVNRRHYHNIVERSETVVKIVDCHVIIINSPHHCGFNRRIIEKSSGHFLIALVVDPIFSPANGQIIICTRRWKACRGLLSIAFDRARHSASNGLNIVDFGPSSSFSRTGDGRFASELTRPAAPSSFVITHHDDCFIICSLDPLHYIVLHCNNSFLRIGCCVITNWRWCRE